MWAFFNRRDLVRKWKRTTDGMTQAQVKSKFHEADINGDGKLNPKEFKRLLKAFGMEMNDQEIEIVINRFDMDNDGDIDIFEFKNFIESEQKVMFGTTTGESSSAAAAAALPPPKAAARAVGKIGSSSSSGRGSAARPPTAPSVRSSEGRVSGATGGTGRGISHVVASKASAVGVRPQSAPRSRVVSHRGSEFESLASTEPMPRRDAERLSTSQSSVGVSPMEAAAMMASDTDLKRMGDNDDIDPLYITHLHKLQAAVESRLGKQYYPTYGLASTVR